MEELEIVETKQIAEIKIWEGNIVWINLKTEMLSGGF